MAPFVVFVSNTHSQHRGAQEAGVLGVSDELLVKEDQSVNPTALPVASHPLPRVSGALVK